jgi:TPR repeat protein
MEVDAELAQQPNLRDAADQFAYAVRLKRGDGIRIDLSQAARYYQLAADQGHAEAQFNFAICLANGCGIDKNDGEAVRYYRLAAAQNHAKAQFNLALCLERGEGVRRDLVESTQYYKLAADQNYAAAQFNYAICLDKGEGVGQNSNTATRYYKLAADSGLAVAQHNYAVSLANDNPPEAVRYYKLAAKQGHADAQRCYGLILEAGWGVCRDLPKALYYFRRSHSSGNPTAAADIDRCRQFLKGETPPPLKDWLRNFDSVQKISPISRTSVGRVMLVKDPRTGQNLALKTFKIRSKFSDCLVGFFLRNFEMLIRLIHPYVIPIVGFAMGDVNHPPQIGMKYAKNGSLRDALDQIKREDRPSFMDATGIAIIICGIVVGMKFFHSRGAMHRDLKPENILIGKHGRPRIAGLRQARFCDWAKTLSSEIGTPAYKAPDFYEEGEYTLKVDVFSFAFILYEVLVGRPAISPDLNPPVVMNRVICGKFPKIPEDMNPEVQEIIRHGWATNADERPPFEDILRRVEGIHYKILPDVDSDKVSAYMTTIREREDFE